MVETCVSPSELHLKKELGILRKSQLLPDPETYTSLRSSFNSGSVTANSVLHLGIAGDPDIADDNAELHNVSPKFKSVGKKVYLYNWCNHLKSSKQVHEAGTIDFSKFFPQSKMVGRKSVGSLSLRRHSVKSSSTSKAASDSSSLATDTVEQFADCYSRNCKNSANNSCNTSQKESSDCASPNLSGSACGHLSKSCKMMKIKRAGSAGSPLSNSYHRVMNQHASHLVPQDGTYSFDGDVMKQLNQQVNGVPCYPIRKNKGTSSSSCSFFSSPSRKLGLILCGSPTSYGRRSSSYIKRECPSKSSLLLPFLMSSFDGYESSVAAESDKLSPYLSELNLEARSRLDGNRWSTTRNPAKSKLSIAPILTPEPPEKASLKSRCRPRLFSEIVGQNIVIQSLQNAIFKGRIAPAYLFQGPHGTGKSSTARVFAAALNCISLEQNRPCGLCNECIKFSSDSGLNFIEVDAKNKKDVGLLKLLLKDMRCHSNYSQYKTFVIEDCHLLSSISWLAFMKYLEKPSPFAVFVFISNDSSNLPYSIVSQCQKFLFAKIKATDMVARLCKICCEEKVDFDPDAIDLIASHSDGSLKDAEIMLHQLTVLGRKITASLINEIVGLVSDEKLVDLLEAALSADTTETEKRSRELLDSGADPVAVMSQLAALVVDIITGSSTVQSCQTAASEESFWGVELGRLQSALEILTVAEKQLRHSSDRSTCFTAALLQLASCNNTDLTFSSSSRSSKNADKLSTEPQDEAKRKELNQTNSAPYPRFPAERSIDNASFKDDGPCKIIRCMSPEKLDVIWQKCIERCHSKTLKKLLVSHGRLVSITEVEGVLIVYIAFGNVREKARAERFLNSITNSIEVVLRQNVEVRIGIVPESYLKALNSLPESPIEKMELATIYSSSENGGNGGFPNMLRKGIDDSEAFLLDDSLHRRSSLGLETNRKLIESTGIQSAKNGERNESRLEKTPPLDCQILQQHKASLIQAMSLKQWEPDMVNEIEEVGIDGSHCLEDRGLEKGLEWHNNLSSPSVFHGSCLKGNSDKYALGYESGYIRPRFCCWRISKARGKMIKQGGYARKQKDGCLQCLK